VATAKYDERVAATKVASGTWDGVMSVNLALDETDERAVHIQGDSEDGVCMVLSPSQQCAYDAFTELRLTRDALLVQFTPEGQQVFEVASVRIDFTLSELEWKEMARVLTEICRGKDYYSLDAG
jgi:hypothetical protein